MDPNNWLVNAPSYINNDLPLNALTMACWRRKDHAGVVVQSDQVANTQAIVDAACSKKMDLRQV